MKSYCIWIFVGGGLLLQLGCAGGKKVSSLEQQISTLEQQTVTLENQLAQMQNERDALSLDKTLQKAELDIVRKDMVRLRATNDSLMTLLNPAPAYAPPVEEAAAMVSSKPASEPIAQKPAAQPHETPPPPEDLPVAVPAVDFQRGYEQALALFHQKKYAEAAQDFEHLLAGDRNHRLSSNCQYWMGECLYAEGRYESALAEFQKVFTYAQSTKTDAAQFKIALCYLQMTKTDEAREAFNRLISAYPNSEFVPRARAHLDKIP